MSKKRGGGAKFAAFMKWVGIAAALLSLGTALYELVRAQAERRERERVVAEQLAAGRAQQSGGDYPAAWESLERAKSTAQAEGLFAKLLGGLSAQQQTLRMAREDLAMEWLRMSHAPQGHQFSETADMLLNVLAGGASTASGARKADLLAHLGWAYFLKSRDGETNVRPEVPYREALAADATNPYANVFWGHWLLWKNGSLSDAAERFAAALATGRARAEVRRFQLAALANVHSYEADAAWLRVVDEMYKAGETLSASAKHDLRGKYYFALNDAHLMERMLAAVPPEEQIELQQMLLQSGGLPDAERQVLTAVVAITLEAAGKSDEALATWRTLLAAMRTEPDSTLAPRANEAVKRLKAKRAKTR